MLSILTSGSLQEVISDLRLDEDQRAKFMAFIRGVGLLDERVLFAMHQLDLKTPKPVIRDRLMSLHEISREHAYRIIRTALETRQKCVMGMAQIGSIVKAE